MSSPAIDPRAWGGIVAGMFPGGLPSLGEMDRVGAAQGVRIWLAVQPTDMRWGFDRLAQQAQGLTGQDPFSGQLFLFRSRGGDRLKILWWDRDGYCLWYKRLEEGVFKLPKVARGQGSLELRASELAMLLEGIDLASVKRVKRYRRPEAGSAEAAGDPGASVSSRG
jgi:transposase